MATARIFQRPKNAMQSGRARTDAWLLEFEPAEAKRPDPLTGWAGSGDTREQVRLGFPTQEAAIALYEAAGYVRWATHPLYAFVEDTWLEGCFYYKDLRK